MWRASGVDDERFLERSDAKNGEFPQSRFFAPLRVLCGAALIQFQPVN
jgi:hypothetical protein